MTDVGKSLGDLSQRLSQIPEATLVELVWSLEGKRMQDVPVVVTRARQPAWTMMKMQPQWTGNWTVEVLNGKGQVIGQRNFAYNPPM